MSWFPFRGKANCFLLGLFTLLAPLIGCNDRQESFYPSLPEAQKDGSIDRGWVPNDLLPETVRNIHEVHDLSPSKQWCAFEFSPLDSQKLHRALKSISTLPLSVERVPRPGVKWWPRVLAGKLDVEEIHKAGLELAVTERPETSMTNEIYLFAVNWRDGRGSFYLAPE